jgi:hypothetical protein
MKFSFISSGSYDPELISDLSARATKRSAAIKGGVALGPLGPLPTLVSLSQFLSHIVVSSNAPMSTLPDVESLHPLHPQIIPSQATINIGTIGHVAHGKSTLVRAISGVQTVRFKTELERNITIKLGYANAKIWRCSNAVGIKEG